MKKTYFLLLFTCLCVVVAACSDDDDVTTNRFIMEDTTEVTLEPNEGAEGTYTFTSPHEWTATCSDDWIDLSVSSGSAGKQTITLTATSSNITGADRTTTVKLTSLSATATITVTQRPFVYLETNEYVVPAEGGELYIYITTDLDATKISIWTETSASSWLNTKEQTRAGDMQTYHTVFNVAPNTSKSSRTTYMYLLWDTDVWDTDNLIAVITIIQEGTGSGTSTDKSADGTVDLLQTASIGSGIPIVLMGDGFIDTEIADGTYAAVMEKAMENLFTEEPLASLRDYFTIYSVTAVSDNNTFGNNYNTAFSCELEGGGSTLITGDTDAVVDYIDKIGDVDYFTVLAVVVLNMNEYAGTTYWYQSRQTEKGIEFSIAYCPIIDNLESDSFRQVLIHEAVGHGFAKLDDEYYYQAAGAIPSGEIAIRQEYQSWGWCQNVDFTSDKSAVLWAEFLNDNTFADEELDVYEGACTYFTGAYRPSYNSMMNDNTVGFNAPSRREIYSKVISRGTGETPSYSDFVEYDMQHRSGVKLSTRRTNASAAGKRPTPPRIDWR